MKYSCVSCGYGSSSWYGRCPQCSEWDTIKEEFVENVKGKKEAVRKIEFSSLSKIKTIDKKRILTHYPELNKALGGGLVLGEVVLMSGEPGVGKSTLLLKSLQNLRVLYVSGEESGTQVRERADRMGVKVENFYFTDEVQIESVLSSLEPVINNFDILVIDSIQTIYSNTINSGSGSVSQIKETSMKVTDFAKKNNLPTIIIGHINKDGDIAGPKILEHLVDAVLQMEGEKNSNFRVLRIKKNRFGPTDEIGLFEMKNEGLEEVSDPTVFLENSTGERTEGKAISAVIEGNRPLFFEIQTLVVPSFLTMPRRVVKGVDFNKVQLILAVLRKNLGLQLDKYDIFVNVVGGIDIKSTSSDLAVAASIISSIKNISIPDKTVFSGEIGLLGEIRKNYFTEKIEKECRRFGFKNIYTSKNISDVKKLNLNLVKN